MKVKDRLDHNFSSHDLYSLIINQFNNHLSNSNNILDYNLFIHHHICPSIIHNCEIFLFELQNIHL